MNKVLIIEDDPATGKVLQRIFASNHYGASLFATAEGGLEACIKELPDLVLLDVILPDGNGIDLCRRMKENARIKHIPVMIISGDAVSVDNKVAGLEAGAEDYILKPFVTEELLERAAGILKRRFEIP